ncbi:MAG: alpha/beta hydrolase [Candidatus Sericytochromatia bacterium]
MKKSSSVILVLSTILFSCQNINLIDDNSQKINTQNVNSLNNYTIDIWNKHLLNVELDGGQLQEGCKPYYKLAKGSVKGSVILFHGYSSCPQQYDDISQLLVNKGYNVFVPLLPGHGQKPNINENKVKDNSLRLPDLNSIGIYDEFAKSMGSMLKNEKGTKIVAGLSVGGAIAAKSMITNQDVFDRGLLMAPFFNAASLSGSIFLPLFGNFIPEKEISWGNGCENQRKAGRAGYCDFKLGNVAAARKFGLSTLKDVDKINKPIQIIGVEKDPAASNKDIAVAVEKIKNSKACFFPKGTNHSMFSPQDNLGVNMFWLSSLKSQIVNYIDTGKNFDIIGESEHNLGLCRYN